MNAVAPRQLIPAFTDGGYHLDGDFAVVGAFAVTDRNMEPEIRLNSVIFYGERNVWYGDGLYVLDLHGSGDLAVYRLAMGPRRHVLASLDNFPRPPQELTIEELRDLHGFYPVLGWAQPYLSSFGVFLRERFAGAA